MIATHTLHNTLLYISNCFISIFLYNVHSKPTNVDLSMSNKPFEEMRSHADAAASLLKSLGNENRLMILCALMNEEMSVGQINELIPISQSALSQHLNYLREAKLVETRRASQNIYYQLKGDETIKVIAVLKSIYCP